MQTYGIAKVFILLIEVIGWLAVAIGLFAGLALIRQEGVQMAVLSGFSITASGMTLITVMQIARAIIDTARNTAKIVDLLEKK
ncbi:hypothetical protein [Sinirhodobacter huangdaonensis]|uniref:DUF4282 domain-containing protein n=1 Tax=Paenirhodobacter huangdaonensis TaxID=2501515 RepID=A0A443M073_9RHOB|nr:hypothetical protein [Sinirhodobacter huangdaonensis]RWR54903.1 hypothetical protein EOW66_02230 [Sinirhodobacter huangdaonensis]